jgi:hypothetical protein
MIFRTLIGAGAALMLLSGVGVAQTATVTVDEPPDQVVMYVREAPAPSEPVIVKEKIVVGQALPETVVVTPVPEYTKYSYAVINDERVIVDPSSRKVIQVLR